MQAAAEPLPDDPDNRHEDEIEVTRVPDAPKVGSPSLVWRGGRGRHDTLIYCRITTRLSVYWIISCRFVCMGMLVYFKST